MVSILTRRDGKVTERQLTSPTTPLEGVFNKDEISIDNGRTWFSYKDAKRDPRRLAAAFSSPPIGTALTDTQAEVLSRTSIQATPATARTSRDVSGSSAQVAVHSLISTRSPQNTRPSDDAELRAALSRLDEALKSRPTADEVRNVFEAEFTPRLSQLADAIGMRVDGANERISSALASFDADTRKLVDRAVEPLRILHDEVVLSADERRELIRRLRPDRFEALEQKLALREKEIESLEATRAELKSKVYELGADLQRAHRATGLMTREEIEAERGRLDARAEKLKGLEALEIERDFLRERVAELEPFKVAYREREESTRNDERAQQRVRELEAELSRVRDELFETKESERGLIQRLRVAHHARTTSLEQSKGLETKCSLFESQLQESQLREEAANTQLASALERVARLEEERSDLLERERAELERIDTARRDLQTHASEAHAAFEEECERARQAHRDRARQLESVLKLEVEARLDQEQHRVGHQLKLAEEENIRLKHQLEGLRAKLDHYDAFEDAMRSWEARASAREEQRRGLETSIANMSQESRKLTTEIAGLDMRRAEVQAQVTGEEQRLQRIVEDRRRVESRSVDPDERIKPIRSPLFERGQLRGQTDEIGWLRSVDSGIRDHDFHFSRRLLEAFHTSLKTSSWAPITVLAGVSGTGKSQLPRLYAHFGGLQFRTVSVQPNWDSPQDLFGFFNDLDGRFKATELLRAMAQCLRPESDGGVCDQLVLILLDEMNRARIDLYFSELLSRLELRRGARGRAESKMPIDLGAGADQYLLELADNVLFTGTMNEDESTHALSDFVLDRSNVLGFPRPRRLQSRTLRDLPPTASWLSRSAWDMWRVTPDDLAPEVRTEIRAALEATNDALSHSRRAIAHRVLQAVENYVANHPRVRAEKDTARNERRAYRDAIEDQFAQRIMPKLRGIDPESSSGGKTLDGIRDVIVKYAPILLSDFETARASAEGGFVWNTASYLDLEKDAQAPIDDQGPRHA